MDLATRGHLPKDMVGVVSGFIDPTGAQGTVYIRLGSRTRIRSSDDCDSDFRALLQPRIRANSLRLTGIRPMLS